ncbi:hypothetical protein ACFWII_39135 [Streptomyces sp. NPDC127063]|uniref:hypothetical protein n=1 Tax=Streptomyces sp. NPDC127063 TaxID=3347123 RepID=UPI003657C1EE
MPTAVALYRGVKELRGDRKVTAADLAEARAILPPPRQLASPDQVPDVLKAAVAAGKVPRLAPPPPQMPAHRADEHQAEDDQGGVTRDQVDEGAEAVAILEAAVAQQRQIYDRVGGGVLAAALLYDPGRSDYLLRELLQYALRTAHRARDTSGDQGED